jgi:hypothetical protein
LVQVYHIRDSSGYEACICVSRDTQHMKYDPYLLLPLS